MPAPVMSYEEVCGVLKQRYPMLMVDRVLALETGQSIVAVKNVTGNEPHFTGHFPEFRVMPGTLIVEAFGQAASILFSRTAGQELSAREFLVLGMINEMRFLVPVVPGDRLIIRVGIVKLAGDVALVEGMVTVDDTCVARGKLSFARRVLGPGPAAPDPAASI